jgi:hypothetical protein
MLQPWNSCVDRDDVCRVDWGWLIPPSFFSCPSKPMPSSRLPSPTLPLLVQVALTSFTLTVCLPTFLYFSNTPFSCPSPIPVYLHFRAPPTVITTPTTPTTPLLSFLLPIRLSGRPQGRLVGPFIRLEYGLSTSNAHHDGAMATWIVTCPYCKLGLFL